MSELSSGTSAHAWLAAQRRAVQGQCRDRAGIGQGRAVKEARRTYCSYRLKVVVAYYWPLAVLIVFLDGTVSLVELSLVASSKSK